MKARLSIDESLFDTRCVLDQDGKVADVLWASTVHPDPTGDIHFARVVDINRGLSAAFLDIGAEQMALLRLRKGVKVTEGQKLFVQITDAPSEDQKLPHVTSKPVLMGRTIMLRIHGSGLEFSRQVQDVELKDRLKSGLSDILSEATGITIRAVGQHLSIDTIKAEAKALRDLWQKITQDPPKKTGMVWHETAIEKAMRDMTPADIAQIVVTPAPAFNVVRRLVSTRYPDLANILIAPRGGKSVQHDYAQDQLEAITGPFAPIPGGGMLTFERTRAMTVVDIDGGPHAAVEANWKAALELKAQLKLRRLGGMIVADFITLPREEARKFGDRLRTLFKDDSDVERIGGPSPNGLVEIIRKRRGQSLADTLEGPLDPEREALIRLHPATVAAEMCRLVPKVAQEAPPGDVVLICAPDVADVFEPQSYSVSALTSLVGRTIRIEPDAGLTVDQFSIEVV